MISKSTMDNLAVRCLYLTEGQEDRDLDKDIAVAIGYDPTLDVPRFTSSFDALQLLKNLVAEPYMISTIKRHDGSYSAMFRLSVSNTCTADGGSEVGVACNVVLRVLAQKGHW